MKEYRNEILILNKVYNRDNRFYFQLFRIPEVLNRLKQYREILNEKGAAIPVWVYSLIQDLKVLTEGHQPFTLNFLISLGLFDRYISHNGWPKYIIGSEPLMSVIAGKASCEEQMLLLNYGCVKSASKRQLYKTSSYYHAKTNSFCLNNLKKVKSAHTTVDLLSYLKVRLKTDWQSFYCQMLLPHEESFILNLKSQGFFVRDFLEPDSSLKWLWPSWKKIQLESLKDKSSQASFFK